MNFKKGHRPVPDFKHREPKEARSGRLIISKPIAVPTLEEIVNYSIPFLTHPNSTMFLKYNLKTCLFDCSYINSNTYVCSFKGFVIDSGKIALENTQTMHNVVIELKNILPLKNLK